MVVTQKCFKLLTRHKLDVLICILFVFYLHTISTNQGIGTSRRRVSTFSLSWIKLLQRLNFGGPEFVLMNFLFSCVMPTNIPEVVDFASVGPKSPITICMCPADWHSKICCRSHTQRCQILRFATLDQSGQSQFALCASANIFSSVCEPTLCARQKLTIVFRYYEPTSV